MCILAARIYIYQVHLLTKKKYNEINSTTLFYPSIKCLNLIIFFHVKFFYDLISSMRLFHKSTNRKCGSCIQDLLQ